MATSKPSVLVIEGEEFQFPEPRELQHRYDRKSDTLVLSVGVPVPAISYDFGDIWVRVVRETGEVVGLEIEDFERGFLMRHPDVAEFWQAIHEDRRRLLRRASGGTQEKFHDSLVQWLRSQMSGQPNHGPAHA